MEFNKCIALNSLVKKEGKRVGCRFDSVSVEFSMYSLGRWSAEITFPEMMFSYEVDVFLHWALSNCYSYVIFNIDDHLVLAVQ